MENEGRSGNQSPEVKREGRSRSRSPLNSSPQERNHSSSRDSSSTRERDRSQRNRRSTNDQRSDDRRRSRAPSNRRVYVANIPYDCKWTDIKDIFREKVGDVSYVELFEDSDGKFRGCGIVEFKDNASVQKAIDNLHRFEIKGRHLVVKEDFDVERDKTGRPVTRSNQGMNRSNQDFNANLSSRDMMGGGDGQFNTYGLSPHFLESLGITGPLTNRVFVANLEYKVTDKKLQDIFKMAGKVMNIELKTDEEGKSKGYGIIEFDHPVEAVQAISMFNGQKLFTRSMSVRMDRYKEEHDGIPSKLPSGLQSVGKGLGSGGQPINLKNFSGAASGLGVMGMDTGPLNTMQGALGNMGMGMGMAGTGMNAGNLGMGMAAAAMTMGAGMNAMGTGTMGAAANNMGLAMGMGTNMNDRSLMAGNMGGGAGGAGMGNMGIGAGNMGLSNRNTSGMMNVSGMGTGGSSGMVGSGGMGSNMNSGMGSGLGGMGMGGNMGMGGSSGGNNLDGFNDFDRGNDNYRSPRSSHSDTIMVRNLPTSYNWQTLRDRFKDIGDVRYTEVKGRGTAIIRFGTERDAQRAVDLMHGIRIDGRPIEVQLY